MRDILSNDGKLKDWNVFKEKSLSSSDYFLLFGVFSAIPPAWKLLIKMEKMHTKSIKRYPTMTLKIWLVWVLNRFIRPWLNESKFHQLLKLSLIPYNVSNSLDWKNIYQLPGRVTLDTRRRSFQYKILNRILYTNSILCKMKLIPSPLCTFCGDHEETLEHIFVTCVYTIEFGLPSFLS